MIAFPRLLGAREEVGRQRESPEAEGVVGARLLHASDLVEGRGGSTRGGECTAPQRGPRARQLSVLRSEVHTGAGLAFCDHGYRRGGNAAAARGRNLEGEPV